MDFASRGCTHHLNNIVTGNAAARHDDDAVTGGAHQLGESGESLGRCRAAAGGEQAIRSGLNDRLEGVLPGAGLVKRAVERD